MIFGVDNMQVPLLDLPYQYRQIKTEIDAAIQAVLSSGQYIMGPPVKEFETNMASFLGVRHAIGVASGSDALLLSLHALGIGPGDRVIVPTFTFFATAGAVWRLGATSVFVDIDPLTYNLDLQQVEDLLKRDSGIKAIIPVHLFGLACDMEKLMGLAEDYNIYVIEDACQAINTDVAYHGKVSKAGTIGHTGCFSFFPTKNLSCFGDGGMVITNDDELAGKIRILRVHGSSPKYFHSVVGYNSRLDTLQAAILNVKLKYLNEWTNKRRQLADAYGDMFSTAGLEGRIKWPEVAPGHVFHQYVIEVEHRDELAKHLDQQGVGTGVYYPLPLHLQECFVDLGGKEGDLPNAEKACRHVLALPIDPELTSKQAEFIVDSIINFVRSDTVD